jgi:hypothetical protein
VVGIEERCGLEVALCIVDLLLLGKRVREVELRLDGPDNVL